MPGCGLRTRNLTERAVIVTADNVEMQGIEFEIINDSNAAVAGIEKLSKALSNLKTDVGSGISAVSKAGAAISRLRKSLDGIDTRGMGDKLKSISDAVNNLKIDPAVKVPASLPKNLTALNMAVAGSDTGKIISLGNALKSMENAGNVRISAALPKNITELGTALSTLDVSNIGKLPTLAASLKPLGEIGRAQMTSFINQLKKLPEVTAELEKVDLDKFTQQMKDLADAMKPFADEMNKVSAGFSAFPSRIQRLITSTEQYNGTVRRATTSTNAWNRALKALSFAAIYRGVSKFLGSAINKASEYQEDLNLFTVSMGQYAEEAYEFAQKVSDVMGIDPAEWMRNQGVFNTIISGFGVAGDKAAFMSKNLTQLSYDLASFYNLDFASSMQKVQSGIAGELEPMRRLGYDLSVARLEQERLNLGIDKSVSSMTQAEKSQLRYYAMMTQVTQVQGDMARTLEQPANMLRVLKAQFEQCARAIGSLFIPILVKVLPFAIAVANALREIITAIAGLFGVTLQAPDWGDSFGGATAGSGAIADNMDSAAGSAKELKRYLAGFDELNVLPDQNQGGGGAGAGGGGGGLDFGELPGYDFLKNAVTEKIDAWKKKLQPTVDWVKDNLDLILEAAEGIAAAFLAWNISNSLISGIDNLSRFFKGLPKDGLFAFGSIGFISDLNEFLKAIKDIQENGANFSNVTKAISEFTGMVADIAAFKGQYRIAGVLKLVQGVGEIVSAIKSIADDGANWSNVPTVLRGVSDLIIGFGFLKKDVQTVGFGFTLQGVITLTTELKKLVDAIKTGDWSDVSWTTMAIGAIEAVGGFLAATGKLKSIGSKADSSTVGQAMQQATETADTLSTGTSTLTVKLKDLAVNMGLGVAILTEVAAGVIIFAGTVAVVGWELDKAGQAWKPVIDNAGTVAIAVGIGTGLMALIGAACYGLGTAGKSAALNIGIGTSILLELGVATGLFIVEIWAIGKGLDEIGKAWEPVLSNGESIATAIGIGTGLLVGVGIVTAALGAATVGTAGLLPLAIGLGTALLIELSIAFVEFSDSLVDVANELNNNLAPALQDLNGTLPGLKSDMHDFTVFMTVFATEISDYTKSMGKITWSTLIGKFQKLFSGNPMQGLATDVGTIATDTASLNGKLQTTNNELQTAIALLTDYISFMDTMKTLTASAGTVELSTGLYTNLKDAGSKLVTGFSDGMMAEAPLLDSAFNRILSSQNAFSTQFLSTWNSLWSGVSVSFVGYWNSIIGNISVGMNSIIYATNNIISAMNAIMHTLGYTGGLTKIPSVSIPRYANGGYVDQGQLFIAREAGAEMVGSIGRRTAVANNDQIVESITYGVREANDDVVTAIYAVAQQIISEMRNQDNSGSGGGYDFDRAVYEANRRNARVYG
nr:MAG TPA: minor tail protein [Caudoviricetes sp.]